ncbi:MAG: FG-GAP repeat domain-containing protein [Sandaracinaceae bacterium]
MALLALVLASGCDCAGSDEHPCTSQRDCDAPMICVDGLCVDAPDGGPLADGSAPEVDAAVETDGGPCGPACRRCRFDTCVPDLGTCTTNDDCPGDSYCSADGECIPYGVPPDVTFDPDCQRREVLDEVRPVEQCSWAGPASDDIEPRSSWIYTAPMIADLNLDDDPGRLQPSVIVTTWYTSPASEWDDRIGMLRIFDGRTCAEQLRFGGPDALDDRPAYGSQWAIADLDGDVGTPGGRPEMVGLRRVDGTGTTRVNLYALAFDVTAGTPSARRLWYGRDCTTDTVLEFNSSTTGSGPSIHDLDDDGVPEILMNSMVFDVNGCVLTSTSTANLPLIAAADVDGDGKVELVTGNALSEWDPLTTEWIPEPYFVTTGSHLTAGHIAIADLGAYSALPDAPLPNDLPEIVVVNNGTIRVIALDGSLVFGPITLTPLGGTVDAGGPPTASDFDGDGQVELAAAAKNFYMVFDMDCLTPGTELAERPGGRCARSPAMAGMPAGVLWAQPAEETSSGVTGSSIFDFDGNGTGEAVYQDECYIRVYEGGTGEVIFSAPASSGTGYELPTIADVDGDFATEIVVPRTPRSASVCGTTDPLFPDSGTFSSQVGFVIYRDPEDRWASSRPIWNQYAYSITHITDDARPIRTSEWRRNWTVPGLNNFRQNVQGDTGLLNIADLTVVFHDVNELCTAVLPAELPLRARVCNRGTNPVSDGVLLQFVEAGAVLCETRTTRLLTPGECEELSCMGNVASAEDLFVRVDPDDEIADCRPGNDEGVAAARLCLE